MHNFMSGIWIILDNIEQKIRQKIEKNGVPLAKWDMHINYGIKTGDNEVFIISKQKREEILSNCFTIRERQNTEEIIRPILRGRDIKRYGYNFSELFLIATFPSKQYDIEDYPAVKKYLLSFGIERLEQTGKVYHANGSIIRSRKKTNNKWFEIQDSINYWEDFSMQKIVYMEIMTDNAVNGFPFPCFSYDTNASIVLNTGYIMTSKTEDVRYVLAVLNSKLGKFLVKMYVSQLQRRQFRMLAQFVHKFPIPHIEQNKQTELITLVDRVLRAKQDKLVSDTIEREIDELVYKIYGLNQEEINYLENSNNV